MVKKTIRYIDWNGVEREEDFYFNLTKAELAHMQFDSEGDYATRIRNIIRAQDTGEIMKIFESIILKAYGEKSADGRRFIKKDEHGNSLAEAFTETPAYDELYFQLIQNPDEFANFVNKLVPSDLAAKMKEMEANGTLPDVFGKE